MSLNRHLVNDTHNHRFVVTHDAEGWEVIEQRDATVLRHVRRRTWQRVEGEIQRFDVTADALKRRGWIEHRTPAVIVRPRAVLHSV